MGTTIINAPEFPGRFVLSLGSYWQIPLDVITFPVGQVVVGDGVVVPPVPLVPVPPVGVVGVVGVVACVH